MISRAKAGSLGNTGVPFRNEAERRRGFALPVRSDFCLTLCPIRSVVPPFKAPLAALAAGFALGIVWAHSFRATLGIHWFLVSAAACILAGLILLRAGWGRTAVWFALASMMFTGVAAARRWEQRFPLNHVAYLESRGVDLNDPVRLDGTGDFHPLSHRIRVAV